MKTVWCHDCKHFKHEVYWEVKDMCRLGHKPRFYRPITMHRAHTGLYGWKKKCQDFKEQR
jgi:hypothetical protein